MGMLHPLLPGRLFRHLPQDGSIGTRSSVQLENAIHELVAWHKKARTHLLPAASTADKPTELVPPLCGPNSSKNVSEHPPKPRDLSAKMSVPALLAVSTADHRLCLTERSPGRSHQQALLQQDVANLLPPNAT